MPVKIRVRLLLLDAGICRTLILLNRALENEASPSLREPVQRIQPSPAIIVGRDPIRVVYNMAQIDAEEITVAASVVGVGRQKCYPCLRYILLPMSPGRT